MYNHILSIILFTPLVGAFVLMLIPGEHKNAIRWVANFFAFLGFAVSLPLVRWFWEVKSLPGFKFVEGAPNTWIPTIGSGYYLGIDGISFLLIMLTTLLGAISILSSWTGIQDRVKEYYAWFLVLQTGMLGVFMSLDFFLFFVFWEAMLVPMYLLIGIWGGPRRLYAAIKFFLYTLLGSVLMLLSVLFLYVFHHSQTGVYTFSIQELYHTAPLLPQVYGSSVAVLLFFGFFVAFAIKVPMFPFHTWLPDAHVEAPTAGSVILAGVLLKMGTYGLIRFSLPFFPEVVYYPRVRATMIALSIIGIIYGGLVSLVQKDMKKLVAYSSVSHLGFCTLGIFALNGPGLSRLGAAAGEPRHLHRRALPHRRHSLRTPAHARHFRVRWHLHDHAGLRNHRAHHVPVVHGAATAQWLRRRVHDSAGRIHGQLGLGRLGSARSGAGRRLSALALSASILRQGGESEERKAS